MATRRFRINPRTIGTEAANIGLMVAGAGLSRKYLDLGTYIPQVAPFQSWIKLLLGVGIASAMKGSEKRLNIGKSLAYGIALDGGIGAMRQLTGDFIPALGRGRMGQKYPSNFYPPLSGNQYPGMMHPLPGNQNMMSNYHQSSAPYKVSGQPGDVNQAVAGPNYYTGPEVAMAGGMAGGGGFGAQAA